MIKVEKFVVNPLGENSFILSDETGECVFIDPGFFYKDEFREIKDYLQSNNLSPVKIANTHGHFDHIWGVEYLRNEYKIPLYMHEADTFWLENAPEQAQMFGFAIEKVSPPDFYLNDNEYFEFGNSTLQIIHIPGHSPGHVVFFDASAKILIAGDVLFMGSIGRTDLPGGDYETLITGIKNKLFVLPDDTKVYCGHGPETTIGFEKKSNPFLK